MKRKYLYLVYLAVLLCVVACSESRYSSLIPFPCEWPASPGYAPEANIDRQNLTEPSGICYHPGRKTLFVVSDEGEIAEMKTDGTLVTRTKVPGDLEGISVDPSTGLIYAVVEGADIILEFDPDKNEVTRRFPISREFQGDANFLQKQAGFDNGIESLVFVPVPDHAEGGTFFAGNQEDPSCIIEILVPLKSGRAAEAEAKILRVLPFKMQDPAAMYFDPETKCLNIVSDTDNILVEITLDGKLEKEYAFPGNDQEGLCTDEDGYIYICQDSNGILKLKDLRKR